MPAVRVARRGFGDQKIEIVAKKGKRESRKIVPEDEIYLRLLKSNVASLKVMEKNGGHIVSEENEHYFVRIKK